MGIFIHYSFHAECSGADLVDRLRGLRHKVKRMRLARVDRIKHMDPVYQPMPLTLLREHGYRLPTAVKDRLKGKTSRDYGLKCLAAAPPAQFLVAEDLELKFIQPALAFVKNNNVFNEADLPEKIEYGSMTYYRRGFSLALADVMLRHGYLLILHPGEGSDTLAIGLTTLRRDGTPIWLGSGFTKTQYAARFVQAHENVCHILDAAREVGLLHQAEDTCGFYEHRNWTKAAGIVNEETTFAHIMGQAFSAALADAQAAGIPVEDISAPATKNYNLIRVKEKPEEGSADKTL